MRQGEAADPDFSGEMEPARMTRSDGDEVKKSRLIINESTSLNLLKIIYLLCNGQSARH